MEVLCTMKSKIPMAPKPCVYYCVCIFASGIPLCSSFFEIGWVGVSDCVIWAGLELII